MGRPRTQYEPPSETKAVTLAQLVDGVRALSPKDEAANRALPGFGGDDSPKVFVAGDVSLARRRCVAVVGSRKVSAAGARLAGEVARGLVAAGVVVVSGLAEGVDAAAHRGAIDSGGKTVAVIGTPLDKAYPAAHAKLQEDIYRDHLLMTPFAIGQVIYKTNFPYRNRIMAMVSDATVIIEAGDTSGTLHQARACADLGRWLFIHRALYENRELTWPKSFVHPKGGSSPTVAVFQTVDDILKAVYSR